MDQWRSKFSESFSLDRYWSIECPSLYKALANLSCEDMIREVKRGQEQLQDVVRRAATSNSASQLQAGGALTHGIQPAHPFPK